MKNKFPVKIFIECLLGTIMVGSLLQTLYGLLYPEKTIELIGVSFATLLLFPAFLTGRFLKKQAMRFFPYVSLSILASAPFLLLWFVLPLAGILAALFSLLIILSYYRSEENLTPVWVEIPHIIWGILFILEYIGAVFRENQTFKFILCINFVLFFVCYIISNNLSEIKDAEDLGNETLGFSRKKMLLLNRKTTGLLLLFIILFGIIGAFVGNVIHLPDIRNFSFSFNMQPANPPEETTPPQDLDMFDFQELLKNQPKEPGWLVKFFKFLSDLFARFINAITWQHVIIVLGIILFIGIISGLLSIKKRESKEAANILLESDSKTISVDRENKKTNRIRLLDFSPSAIVRRRFRRIILKSNKRPLQSQTPEELIHASKISDDLLSNEQLRMIYEKARYSETGCTRNDLEDL